MKPIFLLVLIVMNVLWAGSYSAFKALAPYLDHAQLPTLRFALAAVALALFWPWFKGATPRGRDLLNTCIMGVVVFVLAPRLQVAGVQRGQASDAAVLMALEPLVASVGAAIFLHEHIGPRRWVGFALGLLGIVVMEAVWQPDFKWSGLAANSLFVASFVCESVYSIMGKPLLARAGLFKIIALALIAGTVVNVALDGPATFRAAWALPAMAWGMMLYLSLICTVVGFVVWFIVIRETEVNVTALTVFIQPVVGLIIAVVWLTESLRWGQLWGSLVIMAGLVIGLSRQIKPTAAPAAHQ